MHEGVAGLRSATDGRRELAEAGYVVLRDAIDGAALAAEFDATMAVAFADEAHRNTGSAGTRFRYVPMMCADTPVSLATVRRLGGTAATLIGAAVLPGRTKATTYLSGTGWHRDSDGAARSFGCLCYLDALDADSGALRVVPGSHLDADAVVTVGDPDAGVVLATAPGDVIVFDEHLLHSSTGGGRWRRQWRVDFVADDCGDDVLRDYYAALHAPGWDGGYDVERFPSYGAAWQQLDERWSRRLGELGALSAAAEEEQAALAARRR